MTVELSMLLGRRHFGRKIILQLCFPVTTAQTVAPNEVTTQDSNACIPYILALYDSRTHGQYLFMLMILTWGGCVKAQLVETAVRLPMPPVKW